MIKNKAKYDSIEGTTILKIITSISANIIMSNCAELTLSIIIYTKASVTAPWTPPEQKLYFPYYPSLIIVHRNNEQGD